MHSAAGKALRARSRQAFAGMVPRSNPLGARAKARARAGITVSSQRKRRPVGGGQPRLIGGSVLGPKSLIGEVATDLWKVFKGEGPAALAPPMLGMAGRGMQLQAIGRQQLARVPWAVKAAGAAGAGLGVAGGLEAITGKSPAGWVNTAGRVAYDFTAGQRARRQQMPSRGGLAVGQELPPSHVVVRTWQTFPGGPIFARLADGHIAVQKKDGTIKHFRPYRPVVIPRKWNARSMSRVATALKRQRKTATKIMKITGGMPKGRG